jgi:multidrug efflux pump subunit AcrB
VVKTGEFLKNRADVENIVVGFYGGKPVYLRDVARIVDGPSEIKDYVLFGLGPSAKEKGIKVENSTERLFPAVTIAISKRKGTNAVEVAERVVKFVEEVRGKYVPSNVNITITRNYGETAKEEGKRAS